MKSPCQGFGRQSWVSMSSAHLGVSLLMSLLTVTSALAPSTPGYWKTMHPAEQCRTHLRTSRPVDKALTHQPRGMRMSGKNALKMVFDFILLLDFVFPISSKTNTIMSEHAL
jgi:hypothetical protein